MRFGCFGTARDIETVAQAGFDFIELNLRELIGLQEAEFQNVCARLHACSLGADAVSWILPTDLDLTAPETDYEDWRAYIDTGIERALAIGARLWPVGSGRGRSMKAENGSESEQRERVRSFFAQLAEQTAPAGIRILLEPLGPDYSNYLQTLEQTAAFLQTIPAENLKTMCDLRHMTASGDPLCEIERWADQIAHAHIDLPLGKKRLFPRPDDGFDYTEYFRLLQRAGIPRLSVEALHEENLLEGRESLTFMRKLLQKTGGSL